MDKSRRVAKVPRRKASQENLITKPQRVGEGRRKYRGEEHALYVFCCLFHQTKTLHAQVEKPRRSQSPGSTLPPPLT